MLQLVASAASGADGMTKLWPHLTFALLAAFVPPSRQTQVIGPDVSHFQDSINWPAVAASGVGFVITKATEGITYVDPMFATNWHGMNASGIRIRGAYHFGRPGEDAATQAHHFVSSVGALSPGEFLALDIEVTDGMAPSVVAAWSETFVNTVVTQSGLPRSRVMVYTGAWFWNKYAGGSAALRDHPLWVSGYVKGAPPMPNGWDVWAFWQYTDTMSIAGITGGVDCSRFNGTISQLDEMMGL